MRTYLIYIVTSFVLFFPKPVVGLSEIDSLKELYITSANGKLKVDLLIEISDKLRSSKPDSSILLLNKALKESYRLHYADGIINSCYKLGFIYRNSGSADSSLIYYKTSVNVGYIVKDTAKICRSLIHIGNMYADKVDFKKSVSYQEKCLSLTKSGNYKTQRGMALFNLGNTYRKFNSFKKALIYFSQAKVIFEELKDFDALAKCLNLIGVMYSEWTEYRKSVDTFIKAVEVQKLNGNISGMAKIYMDIGQGYMNLGKPDSSVFFYNKALIIFKTKDNKNLQAFALLHLALAYQEMRNFDFTNSFINDLKNIIPEVDDREILIKVNLGIANCLMVQGKCGEAVKYFDTCLSLIDKTIPYDIVSSCYLFLSQNYMCLGDRLKATVYYKKYNEVLTESSRMTFMYRTAFESDKLEQEIKLLNEKDEFQAKLLDANAKKIQQQKTLMYFFIVGFLFIAAVLLLVVYQYRQKKKANKIITEKNEQLEQANSEIITQRDEIIIQRDLVMSQKSEIEKNHLDITQSINYAKRIQNSILPDPSIIEKYFSEHFIIFMPRDKVSGDFYWWGEVENNLVITVADCTGHGVPGAFMSMLGISSLREIVLKEYISHPGIILKRMRKEIINILRQKGSESRETNTLSMVRDGMDLALCSIDVKSLMLQFAGANNPIWLIHKSGDLKITQYNPDKMPIGIYERMEKFSVQDIQLQKGDCLYLMTDGLKDQFGGPSSKKIKARNVKDILLSNAHLGMNGQKSAILKMLEEWVNNEEGRSHEQTDDITVIGLRV